MGQPVDHRCDLYSLGVMLYEMLCKETPQGAFDPPSQRTGCDTRIDHIVLRAMQQAPDRRYQTVGEVWDALVACAGADEWTSDRARAWWEGRGDAPAPRAAHSREGHTVEIDAAARAPAIDGAGPTMPIALDGDR